MASNVGALSAGYQGVPSLLYYPDIRTKLIARYRDDDFINVMDMMGGWVKKHESQFYTAYDSPLFIPVDTTGSTVTNSGTASITVTSLTTANSGILVKGKLVMLNNGAGGQARVRSVSNSGGRDTVILDSTAAGAPNITLVAGQPITVFSNTQEEGSLQPDPQRWGLSTFYNLTQSFRVTGRITDFQRARQVGGANTFPITVSGKRQYESWEAVRTLMLHRAELGFGLLLGEMSDPNITSASPTLLGEQGFGAQVTRGLIPTIRDFGWVADLATPGTVTLSDLEAINNAITASRGATEYMIIGASAVIARLSSFFKNLGSGGLTSVKMEVKGRKVDLMVSEFEFAGKRFYLKPMNTFDNQQILSTSAAITKTAYFIPIGTATAYSGGKTATQDYLSIAYEPVIHSGDGDEKQAMVHLGALAQNYTNGTAVEDWVYQTIAGLDVVMPYIFGRSRVLA